MLYLAFTKTATIMNDSRKEKLRATFINIIKPELKDEFFSMWTNWFVTEDTAEDEKFPGKLKSTYSKCVSYIIYIFSGMGNGKWNVCRPREQNVPMLLP